MVLTCLLCLLGAGSACGTDTGEEKEGSGTEEHVLVRGCLSGSESAEPVCGHQLSRQAGGQQVCKKGVKAF